MFTDEGGLYESLGESAWQAFWEYSPHILLRAIELGVLGILVLVGLAVAYEIVSRPMRWMAEKAEPFFVQLLCGGDDYQSRCENRDQAQ